jgi:hypothetical protein
MKKMHRGLIWALIAGALTVSAVAPEAYAATSKAAAAKIAAAKAEAAKTEAASSSPMTPSSIGTFKSWTAWKGTDGSGAVCYVSAEPDTKKPDGLKRDPVHFLVVDRKGLGTKNEVQTLIGYPFKKDSKPSVSIDSKTYPMSVDGNGAWLASTGDEPGFVATMKKGHELTVKGTSQRGTSTVDTYTLSGVTAALSAIEKACS